MGMLRSCWATDPQTYSHARSPVASAAAVSHRLGLISRHINATTSIGPTCEFINSLRTKINHPPRRRRPRARFCLSIKRSLLWGRSINDPLCC